eukprot:scaffold3825_cov131-Cylindrotheca_fusiformis.AAC.7
MSPSSKVNGEQQVSPMFHGDARVRARNTPQIVGVDGVSAFHFANNGKPHQTVHALSMGPKKLNFEHESFRTAEGKDIGEDKIGSCHDPTIAFSYRTRRPRLLTTELENFQPEFCAQGLIRTNVLSHPSLASSCESLIPERGRTAKNGYSGFKSAEVGKGRWTRVIKGTVKTQSVHFTKGANHNGAIGADCGPRPGPKDIQVGSLDDLVEECIGMLSGDRIRTPENTKNTNVTNKRRQQMVAFPRLIELHQVRSFRAPEIRGRVTFNETVDLTIICLGVEA